MDLREVILTRTAARAKRFPQLDPAPLDTAGLSARDAALAQAIDLAVARRWLTLRALIETRVDRPWDALHATVQAALLVGLAQLMLLDRVPDYAAIDASVGWAKRKVNAKAGGFVNAVLRRLSEQRGEDREVEAPITAAAALPRDGILLEDGCMRGLRAAAFSEDATARLSQQSSVPIELIDRWTNNHGRAAAERTALHALCHAPILLTGFTDPLWRESQTSRDREGAEPTQEVAGSTLLPHDDQQFRVFDGTHDQLLALLKDHPTARVQDSASAAPLGALVGLEPELIIDVCAGRGTKTRQAAQMFPNATIIASDTDSRRLDTLRRSVRGNERIEVVQPDQLTTHAGSADVLLVDVPCSNTGVLARRPEARYRFSPESLNQLVDLQRQILADHLNLLHPRGRVLYATCSLEPEENEQQTRWLVKWHGFRIANERLSLPRAVPGEAASAYSDGGYFALLERSD